jgi:hypothetical protein
MRNTDKIRKTPWSHPYVLMPACKHLGSWRRFCYPGLGVLQRFAVESGEEHLGSSIRNWDGSCYIDLGAELYLVGCLVTKVLKSAWVCSERSYTGCKHTCAKLVCATLSCAADHNRVRPHRGGVLQLGLRHTLWHFMLGGVMVFQSKAHIERARRLLDSSGE